MSVKDRRRKKAKLTKDWWWRCHFEEQPTSQHRRKILSPYASLIRFRFITSSNYWCPGFNKTLAKRTRKQLGVQKTLVNGWTPRPCSFWSPVDKTNDVSVLISPFLPYLTLNICWQSSSSPLSWRDWSFMLNRSRLRYTHSNLCWHLCFTPPSRSPDQNAVFLIINPGSITHLRLVNLTELHQQLQIIPVVIFGFCGGSVISQPSCMSFTTSTLPLHSPDALYASVQYRNNHGLVHLTKILLSERLLNTTHSMKCFTDNYSLTSTLNDTNSKKKKLNCAWFHQELRNVPAHVHTYLILLCIAFALVTATHHDSFWLLWYRQRISRFQRIFLSAWMRQWSPSDHMSW